MQWDMARPLDIPLLRTFVSLVEGIEATTATRQDDQSHGAATMVVAHRVSSMAQPFPLFGAILCMP